MTLTGRKCATNLGQAPQTTVGTAEQLKEFSQKTKRKWTLGITLKPQLE